MKRHEFFSTIGFSAGMLFLAPSVNSCSKDSASDPVTGGGTPTPTPGIDFTIDLSTPSYAALNSNGGSVTKDGIIIARTSSGAFAAVASACTHQGTPVGFEGSANRFHCPNHSSNFGLDGSVLNGPAVSPLKKYNTALSGTKLRVYS
jgi:cytochrome b6-f complex iron-sulfur subunit